MDSDNAGLLATERLCSGPLLFKLVDDVAVEILVATLPNSLKDPSEFFETQKSKAGEAFREEVLDQAKDWTDWYLRRILSRYDPNSKANNANSYLDITDRLSNFLSGFTNAADRTRRAFSAAGSLAEIISKESGSSSAPLRIQLESDLLDMASRKAKTRENLSRRVDHQIDFQKLINGGDNTHDKGMARGKATTQRNLNKGLQSKTQRKNNLKGSRNLPPSIDASSTFSRHNYNPKIERIPKQWQARRNIES